MSRWFLQQVPAGGDFVVFGLPYAGVGASSFGDWPRKIGNGWFCPLQPPGRENRMHEEVLTHQQFAEQLTEALAEHTSRRYGLIGHCGAVPYLLQTAGHLEKAGLPIPLRLFASSWGAPDKGLYGPLNFVDLDTVDLIAEINALCHAMGRTIMPELAEIAAETMLADLQVQRGYRYDDTLPTSSRVCVIGWTKDEVVPVDQVWPGWQDCVDATSHVLEGDHWELLRCPPALVDLIEQEMTA
ncbi:surfactin synthase thioesterase subunit [Kibdelosporangium banguiense]|uniref:Surfactin synthase thioesterase subunit n=1 Tax=Kibdelosporangium banguiense TaxID=1365924 RepID=A0ABS4TZB9_9PSEU|nr:thioesterase [Kibdelosporangium banguiense]MBP2329721.1 surfactin synthase thioesterase subunit [Kibdelosporangium banguiense]